MTKAKFLAPVLALAISCLILFTGCASESPLWETLKTDGKETPKNLWEDSKALVKKKENVAILLIGGGVSGYVRCAHDDQVEDHFEGHHTFPRDFTIAQGVLGNPLSHFGLAGAGYLYSVSANDQEGHGVWRTTLEALTLNGILTTSLKLVAQDYGPNGESLAWPSGHTSSCITLATVMNEYYGPVVGVPLYGLCGLAMYERMETGEHWASDVVFGAALGYVVGKTVASRHKPEIFGMEVVPYSNMETGAQGVGLMKQF